MAVLEEVIVRVGADTTDFQKSWGEFLKSLAQGSKVIGATVLGVAGITKALKAPTEMLGKLKIVVASVAAAMKVAGVQLVAFVTGLAKGPPSLAAMSVALARIRDTFKTTHTQLTLNAAGWTKLSGTFTKISPTAEQAAESIGKAAKAVEATRKAAAAAGPQMSLMAAVVGGILLFGIEKLTGSLANKLNPELIGIATNAGKVTEATIAMEKAIRSAAVAFESGRQGARAPFEAALAAFVPVVTEANEGLIELAGFVATYASAALGAASFTAKWANNLLILAGVIAAIKFAHGTTLVQNFIKSIDGGTLAAKKLGTSLKFLAVTGFDGLKGSVREAWGVVKLFFARIGPYILVATALALAIGSIVVAIANHITHAKRAAKEIERQKDALRDNVKVANEYIAATKKASEADRQLALAVRDVTTDLRLRRLEMQRTGHLLRGEEKMAAALEKQARAIKLKLELASRLEQITEIEKAGGDSGPARRELREFRADTLGAGGDLDRINTVEAATAEIRQIERQIQLRQVAFQIKDDELRLLNEGLNKREQEIVLSERDGELGKDRAQRLNKIAEEREELDLAAIMNRRDLAAETRNLREDAVFAVEKAAEKNNVDAEGLLLWKEMNLARMRAKAAEEELRGVEEKHLSETQERVREQERSRTTLQGQTEDLGNQRQRLQDIFTQERANQSAREADFATRRQAFEAEAQFMDDQVAVVQKLNMFATEKKELDADAVRLEARFVTGLLAVAREQQQNVALSGDFGANYRDASSEVIQLESQLANLQSRLGQINALDLRNTQMLQARLGQLRTESDLRVAGLQTQEALISAEQSSLQTQIELVGTKRQSAANDREIFRLQQQLIELERDRLKVQREQVVVQLLAAKAAAALIKAESEPGSQRVLQAEVAVKQLEAALVGVDAEITGIDASMDILIQRFKQAREVVFEIGGTFSDAVVRGIDDARRGLFDFEDALEGVKESIIGQFTNAFAGAFREKLKFDILLKKNFLEDIPGFAREGANSIRSIFSNLFGGGAGGGGELNVNSILSSLFGGEGGTLTGGSGTSGINLTSFLNLTSGNAGAGSGQFLFSGLSSLFGGGGNNPAATTNLLNLLSGGNAVNPGNFGALSNLFGGGLNSGIDLSKILPTLGQGVNLLSGSSAASAALLGSGLTVGTIGGVASLVPATAFGSLAGLGSFLGGAAPGALAGIELVAGGIGAIEAGFTGAVIGLAGTPGVAAPVLAGAEGVSSALPGAVTPGIGLGAALGTAGILLAIVVALEGIMGSIAISKASKSAFDQDDRARIGSKAFGGGIIGLIGKALPLEMLGRQADDFMSGDITGKSALATVVLGGFTGGLGLVAVRAARGGTGGTALSKRFEEFIEGEDADDLLPNIFSRRVGFKGIQNIIAEQYGSYGAGKQIPGIFRTSYNQYITETAAKLGTLGGLSAREIEMVRGLSIGHRGLIGTKTSAEGRQLRNAANLLGSVEREGFLPEQLMPIVEEALTRLGNPQKVIQDFFKFQMGDFNRKKDVIGQEITDEEGGEFLRSYIAALFPDLPPGMDVRDIADEELAKARAANKAALDAWWASREIERKDAETAARNAGFSKEEARLAGEKAIEGKKFDDDDLVTPEFDVIQQRVGAQAASTALQGGPVLNLMSAVFRSRSVAFRQDTSRLGGGIPAVDITAELKRGTMNELREGVREALIAGFEDAFLEGILKPALLEPFMTDLERIVKEYKDGTLSAEAASRQLGVAGKEAMEELEGMDEVLEAAAKAGEMLSIALGQVGADAQQTKEEIEAAFALTLPQSFEDAVRRGFTSALSSVGTAAEFKRALSTSLGANIRNVVLDAFAQAFLQTAAFQLIMAPLQGVLATALAEAVAGGITAGTLAGVKNAVQITAAAIAEIMEELGPLLDIIFEGFGQYSEIFGLPGPEQIAKQRALTDETEELQKQARLIQENANMQIELLEKQLVLAAQWRSLQLDTQSIIEGIQASPELGGLTTFGRMELTRDRVNEALVRFRDEDLEPEKRVEAGRRLLDLLPLLLQQGSAALGPASNEFDALRKEILGMLKEVEDEGIDSSSKLESLQKELLDVQKEAEKDLKAIEKRLEAIQEALQDLNDPENYGDIDPTAGGLTIPGEESPYYTTDANREKIEAALSGPDAQTMRAGLEAIATADDILKLPFLPGVGLDAQPTTIRNRLWTLFPNLKEAGLAAMKALVGAILQKLSGGGESPILGFGGGGVVPGPLGEAQLAMVHGQERILTPLENRRYEAGMGTVYAPQVHLHVPKEMKLDEDQLARRTGAVLEEMWERQMRTGGRMRHIMRDAFPTLRE